MSAIEERVADTELIRKVSAELYGQFIHFAHSEHFVNRPTGNRHTTTAWTMQLADSLIRVDQASEFSGRTEDFNPDQSALLTVYRGKEYGTFDLSYDGDTHKIEPIKASIGQLKAQHVLDIVGVGDTNKLVDYLFDKGIPKAAVVETKRSARFTKLTGEFGIAVALKITSGMSMAKVERLLQLRQAKPSILHFVARQTIVGNQPVQQWELVRYARESEDQSGDISDILTVKGLVAVLNTGRRAIEYADGFAAGELAYKSQGPAKLHKDTPAARQGYDDSLAIRPQ